MACASVTGLVTASLAGVVASAPARTATPLPATTTATASVPTVSAVERGPVRTVQGPATQLWNPGQVAVAPGGALVVANEGDFAGTGGSVTVHAAGASGNVAPQRRIAGPSTGLVQPAGVDVDTSGRIYVADAATETVSVFAAGATGNVAPLQQLRGAGTGLDEPTGLDVEGNRLAVANRDGDSLTVYAVSGSGTVSTTPERTVTGPSTGLDEPVRVALRDGELTAATWDGRVLTYAAGAGGNATPARTLRAHTGGPVTGLALDARGRVHVALQYADEPVRVFAAGATGSAAPVAFLSGELHDLDLPRGLALRPDGQVVVTDEADDALYTYDSLVSDVTAPQVRKPGKVRALKVAKGPRKLRRPVTWRVPKADGGAPVTGYRVVVKKGKRTVLTRTVAKRRVVLRRGQLPRGKLQVRVAARNSEGFGPVARKRFRVRK